MILVQDGDNYFTAEDFFYNEKEHYIKVFYKGGKTRTIQNVRCNPFIDNGVIRIILKSEAYEKTR